MYVKAAYFTAEKLKLREIRRLPDHPLQAELGAVAGGFLMGPLSSH
jgi:hypothetical protein